MVMGVILRSVSRWSSLEEQGSNVFSLQEILSTVISKQLPVFSPATW